MMLRFFHLRHSGMRLLAQPESTPAALCGPHAEGRSLRRSPRVPTRAPPATLRDAAKWPLLRMRAEHDAEVFPPSSFRDAPLGAGRNQPLQRCVVLILRSALFARVSKDGNEGARGHPSRRGQVAAPQDEGGAQSCILEKSATARVAVRISLSSFRRFSRTSGLSSLTLTLSKNASTAGRSLASALIALSKSSFITATLPSTFARSIAFASAFSSARP